MFSQDMLPTVSAAVNEPCRSVRTRIHDGVTC
jgi:hypothetical protein